MNVLQDSYTELPGPKLAPKNNLRLFYGNAIVNFIILVLILSISGYTGYVVSTVHEVATNTQKLIDDVHALVPEAEMGVQLLRLLCKDKNFTRNYNHTKEWCEDMNNM